MRFYVIKDWSCATNAKSGWKNGITDEENVYCIPERNAATITNAWKKKHSSVHASTHARTNRLKIASIHSKGNMHIFKKVVRQFPLGNDSGLMHSYEKYVSRYVCCRCFKVIFSFFFNFLCRLALVKKIKTLIVGPHIAIFTIRE